MNTGTKINYLMQSLPRGSVLLPAWLLSQGYSYELQQSYRKSGWLKSIGKGAMLKSGDPLVLAGALSALQNVENINIHIGGRSALELQGLAHYLQINSCETALFVNGRAKLPFWFTNNSWDTKISLSHLSLLNNDQLGMIDFKEGEITMKISNADRAVMDHFALAPSVSFGYKIAKRFYFNADIMFSYYKTNIVYKKEFTNLYTNKNVVEYFGYKKGILTLSLGVGMIFVIHTK